VPRQNWGRIQAFYNKALGGGFTCPVPKHGAQRPEKTTGINMTNDDQKPRAGAMAAGQSSGVGAPQMPTSPPTNAGGEPYLRLLRNGTWVMGAEDSQIADGTKAIINSLSIQHGYSCWTDRAPKDGENENLGEQMWKITQPKSEADELPAMFDPRT
jgi:hypothetical protein